MKCGMRMAGAVGVGYVLGRTRKMKFALMLAGFGLARQDGVQGLRERATSLVGSSPELAKITESVRGELLDAARTAAITAAGNRVDALNARLQPHPGDAEEPDEEDLAGTADEDTGEDEPADGEKATEGDAEPEARPRRAPARGRTTAARRRTTEQPARASARSGERRSATSRRPRAGAESADSAPVRRTRR
ncbi:hypothetical protein [Nocardia sp. NPDC024068]|uniref:hypothetical protein n=1 Tax=Nocardia sp. NPDC024068 TaxID=3157197 RepID=UPI0033E2A695